MLKKLLTGCLTIVAAAALAVPAMADGSVTGRVRGFIGQVSAVSNGESAGSVMQFQSDSRIQLNGSGEAGSFTGTAKVELDMGSDGTTLGTRSQAAAPTVRQAWVQLANDSFSVRFGRDLPFGVYYLPKYVEFVVPVSTFWIGEDVTVSGSNERTDYLNIGLMNIGPGNLNIILGMNTYGQETDSTTDQYNETTVGAKWAGAFGAVGLQVEYASSSTSVDTSTGSQYAGVKDTEWDGGSKTNISFAVSYAISDLMGVGVNVESQSRKAGGSSTDTEATTAYELYFNLGLDETQGISLGYGAEAYKASPDADQKDTTEISFGYAKTMGMAKLYAGYYSNYYKIGSGKENGKTMIALGSTISF
jgi:hypothetical protein